MDDLVELWGIHQALRIIRHRDEWNLKIGGCRFGFIDNELLSISIRKRYNETRISAMGFHFHPLMKTLVSAFENLTESNNITLKLRTKNGYILELYFRPDTSNGNKLKLITIRVHHPNAGK